MADMKDVVNSLLGHWAIPALKLIQIVSLLFYLNAYGLGRRPGGIP